MAIQARRFQGGKHLPVNADLKHVRPSLLLGAVCFGLGTGNETEIGLERLGQRAKQTGVVMVKSILKTHFR